MDAGSTSMVQSMPEGALKVACHCQKTVQGCPAVGLDEQLGAFDIHQAHEGHGHGIEDPDILGSHAEA